jgi:maleamate amidohydrolase
MTDDFEDHCWMDIVPPDVLEVYSMYRRKTFVGPCRFQKLDSCVSVV